MILNKHVRTLASASLLALAIGSVAVGFADAKTFSTKGACESAGFKWHPGRGCIDQTCEKDGKTYDHGEGYRVTVFAGQHRMYVCDGVTGQFYVVRTAEPQGPLAPHSTTTGTNAPPEQAPANPVVTTTTGTYSEPTQPTPTPVIPRTTGTYSQP